MPETGLAELGHLEQGVDVHHKVESMRPDAVVAQDDVILQDVQQGLLICQDNNM